MNRQEILKKIEEKKNELAVNQGLYSPTSEMFRRFEVQLIAYTKCENYVQQLDEPQKPVVPTCAEPWLEQAQYSVDIIGLFSEVDYATDSDGFISKNWQWSPEFYDWLREDADTLYLLCDALRYGYEVVKEPLYYVPLPFEVWDEEAAELKKEFLYLAYDLTSDETRFFYTKEPRRGFSTKLDEITIKSANENYWPFAVPVEEVAEG